MKYTFLLLILFSLSVKGQTRGVITRTSDGLPDSVYKYHVYDTIHAMFLCADTSREAFYNYKWYPNATTKGYMVNKNHPSYDGWDCGGNWCLGWRDHWDLVEYLDQDKKPLKYFVWMVKELK